MVLKEKKTGPAKRSAAVSTDDSELILARLENPKETDVSASLRAYLYPVAKLENPYGKENVLDTEKHRTAKQFVPFLARVLKSCSNSLSKLDVRDCPGNNSKADDLFSAMSFALDCFENLRHFLTGSKFEIELQRSWLVRRLMVWKRFREAFFQDLQLVQSLCLQAFKPDKTSASLQTNGHKNPEVDIALPSPDYAKELTQNLVILVVGAATDLVVCGAEFAIQDTALFEKVLILPDKLEPWLSKLQVDVAEKQRGLLFRGLHKCLTALITGCLHKHPKMVEKTISLTLHQCAFSSTRDHFCKLVRSLCSRLTADGLDGIEIAMDVYKEAILQILRLKQLQRACKSHEVLDLFECYARLCQSAKKNQDGWWFICKLSSQVVQDTSTSLVKAVGGLYAVGLLLTDFPEPVDKIALSKLTSGWDSDCNAAQKASRVLQNGIVNVQRVFACIDVGSTSKPTNELDWVRKELEITDLNSKELTTIFVSIHRALDFLRRSASRYAQSKWDMFIATHDKQQAISELDCSLEQALFLFCKSTRAGLSSTTLSSEERENFQRGSKCFFPAGVAAFRLSLLTQDRIQEIAVLLKDSLSDFFLYPEDLRWLMSSSYNMGVQLFNLKLHDMACEPFEVSYSAAWVYLSSNCKIRTEHTANVSSKALDCTDILKDAFQKSSIHIDNLIRSGDFARARNILCDSLQQWAGIKSADIMKLVPLSLLQLWFKRMIVDDAGKLNQKKMDENLICNLVSGFQPPLPPEFTGLVMEEELSFFESLEEAEGSLSLPTREKIIDFLLERIYTNKSFSLQRSRILIEKGRLSRILNMEGHNDCLLIITQAIDILANSMVEETSKLSANAHLGSTYFLRALCSQEADPLKQDFLNDINNGLVLWEGLLSSSTWMSDQENTDYWSLTKVDTTSLLHNVADLLALKGYSTLQYRVYFLLLDMLFAVKTSSEDACLALFRDCCMSHALCIGRISQTLPAMVTQKLGLSFEELCKIYARRDPNSVASALFEEILQEFSRSLREKPCDELSLISWSKIIQDSHDLDLRTNKGIAKLSQAFFMVAESCGNRGKLEEALHNSKEGLRLRLKLLNRCFKISELSALPDFNGVDSSSEKLQPNALQLVAVNNRTTLVNYKRQQPGPSQWRVVADYLESLLQVGILNNIIGAVDDAERSFKEGLQIATCYGLSFGGSLFESYLGEVQRKKHLWELAERSLQNASCALEQSDENLVCKHCVRLGGALLDFHTGNLERRRTDKESGKCVESLMRALKSFESAEWKLDIFVTRCPETTFGIPMVASKTTQPQDKGEQKTNKCGKSSIRKQKQKTVTEDQRPIRNRLRSSSRSASVHSIKDNRCSEQQYDVPEINPVSSCNNVPSCNDTGTRGMFNTSVKTMNGNGWITLSENTIEELCAETSKKMLIEENKMKKASRKQSTKERNLEKPHTRRKNARDEGTRGILQHESTSMEGKNQTKLSSRGSRRPKAAKEDGCDASSADTNSGVLCLYQHQKVWQTPSSFEDWLDIKWKWYARRLMARVLLQKAKCMMAVSTMHEAHQLLHQALSLLNLGECPDQSSIGSHGCCQLECLALKESEPNPIEEGCLLYHISMLTLRQNCNTTTRDDCCCLCTVGVGKALLWLYHAFILCSEVPPIMRKVARVLAILHVPMELGGHFDFETSIVDGIHANRVASYFHQASLGATTRQLHLCRLNGRKCSTEKTQISSNLNTEDNIHRMQEALRISPRDLRDLKFYIQQDLKVSCSVSCMSLVDHEIEFIHNRTNKGLNDSWLLISRFDADAEPFSILLSCSPPPESVGRTCNPYSLNEITVTSNAVESNSETAYRQLVTRFENILEESRQSTSQMLILNSIEEKSKWWEWRMDLDARLQALLRFMEHSWLGPWKCFLLGNFSTRALEIFKESSDDLKKQLESMANSSLSTDVNLIRFLLQGTGSITRKELERGVNQMLGWTESVSKLRVVDTKSLENAEWKSRQADIIEKAATAFVGQFQTLIQKGYDDKWAFDRAAISSAEKPLQDSVKSECLPRNLFEDFKNVENLDLYQEPVVLVLDEHLQGFPWESLPTLRKRELYRMPSLGSMRALLFQRDFLERKKTRNYHVDNNLSCEAVHANASCPRMTMPILPSVDPSSTFYVLNPSGDLVSTQAAFEDWFKCQQGWEGTIGQIPTVQEYMNGLQTRDLFVYLGHGSGDQYLPERRMSKMECCAAALLMGCSSGRLRPQGDYEPVGVPWSYLMAGCPTAVANLWDVTDGDIDRFSRVLLQKWLEHDVTENKPEKGTRKVCSKVSSNFSRLCCEEVRVASHIGEGRNSCRLPCLIGSSPVCYGIPTLINKQTHLST